MCNVGRLYIRGVEEGIGVLVDRAVTLSIIDQFLYEEIKL